ncbi:MAG: DNA-3-methyladenine glycosylase I [Polyangiaceae bacterium]|nr:DNA-3-methyladenine glycosylase I [Polyangiaceae bacterium]
MPAPKIRCAWAGTDPIYVAYHDTEWGVPVRDDRLLFEFLVLQLRRLDHRLCAHAGGRHGQRPRGGLLPPSPGGPPRVGVTRHFFGFCFW